jgi:FkbH-like protein
MKYSEIIKLNNELGGTINSPVYRLAVLSNIMMHQSKDVCEYTLRAESLNAEVIFGEYDNIVQDSQKFQNLNAVLIFWEACNFIDGLHYKIDSFSEIEFNDIVNKVKLEIDLVLSALKNNSAVIIINKFSSIVFDQFSLSDGNLNRLTCILNNYLKENIDSNIHLFDINKLISRLSIESATDLRFYYSSKSLYSINFFREYFENIKYILLGSTGKIKKALIFDCDNTLWRGVIGEDGFNGVEIFKEIQFLALELEKKGVIIGLCSKNNPEDIDYLIENHPDILLKDKNIVIKKVNWKNKVSNLKSISNDLNIGLDSIVFLDDSSFEVELIKKELPNVTVFKVPPKEYEYGLMLRKISNLFYTPSITQEDKNKTKMYKDQAERSKHMGKELNIEDYLASLDMSITIHENNSSQVSRISQLTQKTNQFNLTTKRYSESEIKELILSENKLVLSIDVDDKYGPSGLTGLAILCLQSSNIDSFLLSCRVLGRNIEFKFIDALIKIAKENNLTFLNSKYISTQKNQQVRNFYNQCGFDLINETNNASDYCLNIDSYKAKNIQYIRLKTCRTE